ncbi:hypothetical protein JANAI62_29200 [Jannaschia pagri]|uniref:Porin n=1 Tax=Jannaschia pagri TaxID=2829797 RepID=A0ABQ4NQE0_9RHOB|nr:MULTISPECIES: hypothetical protein [unclassified Jannaschia]GIT92462.1 hypothetical protein JANAI61_29200 [Jannaschia sp. AI_61]GIT96297.1 hypothetical protein JANAI62_29200 [Jannaschia sp. AI_62]
MKTLILSAIVAAASIAGAASAQVPAGAAGAIAYFNQDIDRANDRSRLPSGDATVTVSTRSGSLGEAFAIFNATEDNANDRRGLNGATVVGKNTIATDIFARFAEESRDDD